jgi:general secretion pathway protein F
MRAFNYQAVDKEGIKKNGILEADSAKIVRQQLRDKGLIPVSVLELQSKKSTFANRDKLKVRDLSLMTRQLATLIAASLPIEQALQGVSEQSEKKQAKTILLGIRAKVLEGHSLANAMKNLQHFK